ncbi:hypothetical protein [Sulfurimonas sp.]|uniref:hypothetical protein n=1 Tax=Sulfurimonas sp. TaxID=2022749 RepID=UPI00263283F8|nr:hypothetical protein [Sulfurimonas sp.]
MQIFCTETYQMQLHSLLEEFSKEQLNAAKSFKLYLDTVIINIPTKVQKFKKSTLFNDENIKDLEHKGLRIPFYYEEETQTYLILGIVKM